MSESTLDNGKYALAWAENLDTAAAVTGDAVANTGQTEIELFGNIDLSGASGDGSYTLSFDERSGSGGWTAVAAGDYSKRELPGTMSAGKRHLPYYKYTGDADEVRARLVETGSVTGEGVAYLSIVNRRSTSRPSVYAGQA